MSWMTAKNNDRRDTTKKLENKVEEIQKAAFKELNVFAEEFSSDHCDSFEDDSVETAAIHKAKKLDLPRPKAKKVKGRGRGKVVVTEKIKGIEIVTTTEALQEGLSIVRPLGDGKFEIINLQALHLSSLNAKGAGLHLHNDLARANAFYLRGDQWVDAITKCAFAARYADKHIFPFHKLPIELRSHIYELVVFSPNGIRPPCSWNRIQNNGVKVLHICRGIREEAKKFFFKNKFSFQDSNSFRRGFLRPPQFFQENIKEVSYHWEGRTKEISNFVLFAKLSQLNILHITFGVRLLDRYTSPPARANKLHQDEENIKRFSVLAGFDKLSLLRGLECVTFALSGFPNQGSSSQLAKDDADIDAFEEFLQRTLTQPKPEALLRKTQKKKRNRKVMN